MGTDDELDFTHDLDLPAPQPTAEQHAQAEKQTMGGMRAVQREGYYVNILHRPGKRIPPRSGNKHCVLVMDGDQTNALLLARALMLAGLDVRSATNRDEIVVELKRQPAPDAIVMGSVLPAVKALDLLSRLRGHPTFGPVPIIIIAAKFAQEDMVAALARGASGYMTKPFKPEALLDTVKAVLGLG